LERGYSVVNDLPPGFSPDYTSFIFSDPKHLQLQAEDWLTFYLIKKVNQKIMARVSFHISDGQAITPVRAPFGSVLFSERLSPRVLYEFLQQIEAQLRRKNVRSICLTEPPLFYRKFGELLHTTLLNLDYRVSRADLSTGIRIDHINFEEKIESWEKRKLKQAREKGLGFKVLPFDELEVVYQLIERSREQRGHVLSMKLDEVKRTAQTFKDSFCLFGTFLQKEMAAASIAIRVNPRILYNFYSGHLKKFDSVSPVVMLTQGMYKFCRSNSIELLDLGTSSLNGRPNFSLLDFKLRLGGVPSMKITFEKELL
jgi:hypothetical protein